MVPMGMVAATGSVQVLVQMLMVRKIPLSAPVLPMLLVITIALHPNANVVQSQKRVTVATVLDVVVMVAVVVRTLTVNQCSSP